MFSRTDGHLITEREHIFESIETILTTPVGSRVMRRTFGSNLKALIGQPLNPGTITAIYAATNEAIATWEPRVDVVATHLDLENAKEGIVNLRIFLRIQGENVEGEFRISDAART